MLVYNTPSFCLAYLISPFVAERAGLTVIGRLSEDSLPNDWTHSSVCVMCEVGQSTATVEKVIFDLLSLRLIWYLDCRLRPRDRRSFLPHPHPSPMEFRISMGIS